VNDNLIVCVAVLAVCLVLMAFGVLALSGWLLTKFSKETCRILWQADQRVSAANSVTEKALSRITAIIFPQGHQLFRRLAGGAVMDGAQQQPKPGFLDELDAGMAHVAQVNGTRIPVEEEDGS